MSPDDDVVSSSSHATVSLQRSKHTRPQRSPEAATRIHPSSLHKLVGHDKPITCIIIPTVLQVHIYTKTSNDGKLDVGGRGLHLSRTSNLLKVFPLTKPSHDVHCVRTQRCHDKPPPDITSCCSGVTAEWLRENGSRQAMLLQPRFRTDDCIVSRKELRGFASREMFSSRCPPGVAA